MNPRIEARDVVAALQDDPALKDNPYADEHPWDQDRFDRVLEYLKSGDETLTPEVISEINELASGLSGIPDAPQDDEDATSDEENASSHKDRIEARSKAVEVLHGLVAHERSERPANQVVKALGPVVPTFLSFDEHARSLDRDYDLNTLPEPKPLALQNLANLAQLDLDELREQVKNGNAPEAEALLEQANSVLKEDFEHSWGQSEVYVRLSIDGSVLHLLVSVEGGATYSWIDERSDGLRTFVALRAFVAGHKDPKPILLVDEAETHLHYDAQVDLVEVLQHQTLAAKIVYTTHSVGCLPPDLGSGIRAVVPIPGQERSRIDNSFWTAGPGLTPLLFGMGASLLALAIPRRVVLTEGSSDCVLYPTLLRQATGESELEFRFAPGLSSASDATLRELDSEGGRVAFLVDGDESGDRIRTRLEKAGVAQAHIISIRELTGSPVTIEDFVSAEVFAAALNALLHRWNDLDSEIQVSELRDNNRWTLCEEWCEQHGVAPPSKLQLAQEVVDRRRSPDAVGDEPSEPFKVISDFYQPALSELLGRVRNIVKPS